MDNLELKLIFIFSIALAAPSLLAQEPTSPPPLNATVAASAPNTAPTAAPTASSPDLNQFQNWLKNNELSQQSKATISLPPSAPAPVMAHQQKPDTDTTTDPLIVISKPLSYSESQAAMLRAAPPGPATSEESNIAFNSMMQKNMPLTPEQVVKLRQLIDSSQRAAAIPATIPPKPVSSTLMINLAPGATPPAIRLAQGYITSLVFVDSTGAAWPIAAYDIGNPKNTTIQWDGKSNILLIQATSPYSDGDLVIRLVGLATPITLELVTGQRVVDYRTDIHVSGIGPNTKDLPIGTGLPNSANQLLLSVLDGVAPPGSRELIVKAGCGDCQAWLLGSQMFLRTRFTVLSPGWTGRMTSPDGMIAYELPTSSSVLISQYGDPVEIKIEGF